MNSVPIFMYAKNEIGTGYWFPPHPWCNAGGAKPGYNKPRESIHRAKEVR